MMHYQYDDELQSLPTPTDQITIFPPRTNKRHDVLMVLDSGAEMTCIPAVIINSLGHLRYGSVTTIDYDGRETESKSVFVDLEFKGGHLRNIEVLPIDREYGFLGRDVLNNSSITLDGPAKEWYLN